MKNNENDKLVIEWGIIEISRQIKMKGENRENIPSRLKSAM